MSNTDTSSIDSILDATLDDLKDLPEFTPFHPGTHIVSLKWDKKIVNDKPCLELTLTMVETVELVDSTLPPNAAGSTTSTLYQLTNEISQGKLKEVMKVLATSTGLSVMSEIIAASNGLVVKAVTSVRADKTDPTKMYGDLKRIEIV